MFTRRLFVGVRLTDGALGSALFQVKMLIIHRWFDISAAERDLKYKPIVTFADGYSKTIDWLRKDWLPKHKAKHG